MVAMLVHNNCCVGVLLELSRPVLVRCVRVRTRMAPLQEVTTEQKAEVCSRLGHCRVPKEDKAPAPYPIVHPFDAAKDIIYQV